jgi:NAD(P)-dependent dehydrogenase (short-subunit alcohol dehydrogenase family)
MVSRQFEANVPRHKPVLGGAHFAAAKAAMDSLTRSWALELAPSHPIARGGVHAD